MWGRYHHANRVEASRRARYDQRLSRAAKKREMQRIKTMWGYDRTPMLPPELEQGEHDLHYKNPHGDKGATDRDRDAESSFGSDSDGGKGEEVDERYPGTLKILSLALLGEGSKGELPETRGEGGRKYEAGVQRNGWLAVKVRRWIGRDEEDLEDTRYTVGPSKVGRRIRHALSRDRLRAAAAVEAQDDEKSAASLASPMSTLSVGSGEIKYKAEFSSVDLTHQTARYSPNRYSALGHSGGPENEFDDPFLTSSTTQNPAALGWKKPLPPQPKESPFRPSLLNFGLRSRSKTYDPVSPHTAQRLDTPVKPAPLHNYNTDESGFLPKTLGLGISGVWKTITNFTHPTATATAAAGPVSTEDDEESFIGRPYRPHSDVMSDNDTPYSAYRQHRYDDDDLGTPTKQPLARTGTVLHVKPTTNQPWNTTTQQRESPARKMTAAAWNEALLSSPVNSRQTMASYQPMRFERPLEEVGGEGCGLEMRKLLLLHRAVTEASAKAEGGVARPAMVSPAFTDYSDLVACYSTPSDVDGGGSIRVLSPPVHTVEGGERESVGARQKLQRAKTTKMSMRENGQGEGVQRSKTSSTSTSGLNRKSTVHHSVRTTKPSNTPPTNQSKGLYPYTLTQPLRLAKPSSSPPNPSPPTTFTHLPPALRIASPEPAPPHHHHPFLHHPHHHQPPPPTTTNHHHPTTTPPRHPNAQNPQTPFHPTGPTPTKTK